MKCPPPNRCYSNFTDDNSLTSATCTLVKHTAERREKIFIISLSSVVINSIAIHKLQLFHNSIDKIVVVLVVGF